MNTTSEQIKATAKAHKSSTGVSVSWQVGKTRLHIWVDPETLAVKDNRLYKNSIAGFREPGYFKTRYLDARHKVNREIITLALSCVSIPEAITVYKLEQDREEQQRRDSALAIKRKERLDAAAPDLLAACKAAEANLSPLYPSSHLVMESLRAAIAKATESD